MSEFTSYPAAARRASFDPANVAHARLFALQAAFRAVRPNDALALESTRILSIALSQQMTGIYQQRGLTIRQKQDARDYYVIARALFLPAVPGTPESHVADPPSRQALVAKAARLCSAMPASIQPQRLGASSRASAFRKSTARFTWRWRERLCRVGDRTIFRLFGAPLGASSSTADSRIRTCTASRSEDGRTQDSLGSAQR
jgi:hypothetical protein